MGETSQGPALLPWSTTGPTSTWLCSVYRVIQHSGDLTQSFGNSSNYLDTLLDLVSVIAEWDNV